MSGFDISNLLGNGGQEIRQVAVVEERRLQIHNITVQQDEDGLFIVHLDVLWSPQAALRYSLPFDRVGLQRFMNKLRAAETGLEIADSPFGMPEMEDRG